MTQRSKARCACSRAPQPPANPSPQVLIGGIELTLAEYMDDLAWDLEEIPELMTDDED